MTTESSSSTSTPLPPVVGEATWLPFGRREEWQDVPDGCPQGAAYAGWLDSERIADLYGDQPDDNG
jgi:hypothetical protein